MNFGGAWICSTAENREQGKKVETRYGGREEDRRWRKGGFEALEEGGKVLETLEGH